MKRLTPKQVAFCEHFAACGNATKSAKLAGYKKPDVQGSQSLRKLCIQEYIKELEQDIVSKRIATAIERQELWTVVMRDNDTDMKHRLKASELLGKSQGDFIDRVQHEGNIQANMNNVVVYIPSNGRD